MKSGTVGITLVRFCLWSHICHIDLCSNFFLKDKLLVVPQFTPFKDHDKCQACHIIHTLIPFACAECDDSLPFSGSSSIPVCYVLFPATLLHQLFFHPLSPHLAIYFLVYLSILLFSNSYIILYWGFYFLPFSVHAQTNVIYLTLLSLL